MAGKNAQPCSCNCNLSTGVNNVVLPTVYNGVLHPVALCPLGRVRSKTKGPRHLYMYYSDSWTVGQQI